MLFQQCYCDVSGETLPLVTNHRYDLRKLHVSHYFSAKGGTGDVAKTAGNINGTPCLVPDDHSTIAVLATLLYHQYVPSMLEKHVVNNSLCL